MLTQNIKISTSENMSGLQKFYSGRDLYLPKNSRNAAIIVRLIIQFLQLQFLNIFLCLHFLNIDIAATLTPT